MLLELAGDRELTRRGIEHLARLHPDSGLDAVHGLVGGKEESGAQIARALEDP